MKMNVSETLLFSSGLVSTENSTTGNIFVGKERVKIVSVLHAGINTCFHCDNSPLPSFLKNKQAKPHILSLLLKYPDIGFKKNVC